MQAIQPFHWDPRHCTLCPRTCGADRLTGEGLCGGGGGLRVARAALHPWEEPCISGSRGSGTVFFSGCSLRCCFCQNYRISAEGFGRDISAARLSEIFLELQEQGAHNINLVNPTHLLPWIVEALDRVQGRLTVPVVYNTGGYDRVESLQMLEGRIQIYLPDLKYKDPLRSQRYSGAADYFAVATRAIEEMFRQVGPVQVGKDGLLRQGLVIRHMVMPGGMHDSMDILRWVRERFQPQEILISLMSQYTPCYNSGQYPEISRRISTYEYNRVADEMLRLGLTCGFMQQKSSAKEEYTPSFDLEGV